MERALGWHVMMRLVDGRVLAADADARRRLARVVLGLGRGASLISFRAADTHLHALVACTRPEAGRFAHDVEVVLGRALVLAVPFAPAHLVAVVDQAHLRNTFRYVLGQEGRHGTASDPLHEASNLPDLLGMRGIGAYTIETVRRHLPRTSRSDLVVHLPAEPVESEGLVGLAEAVEAVAAAATGAERSAVRQAGVHAAGPAVGSEALAAELGVSLRSVQRWRTHAPKPALVRAVRLQLGLRRAVGSRAA